MEQDLRVHTTSPRDPADPVNPVAPVDPVSGAGFSTLRFERRGAGAWIILDRPEVLNSVNPAMVADLDRALELVERDPAVRCVVVTGEGRAFSVGGDLKAAAELAAEQGDAATDRFLEAISRVLSRLEALPVPVIAAVNGFALAGGLEIVLCCDLVVAAENARFGDAHARYGLLPGGGGSVRLPRKLGANRAKYLMFTATQVTAARMMEWGLVAEVVPAAALAGRVEALVADLAGKSPLALKRMKRMIDDGLEQPLDQALRLEQTVCALHNLSHDRNEGLAAFNEKREPRFLGR